MTFQEWWAGLGRSSDPETIWKAAQRAAVAEEREAHEGTMKLVEDFIAEVRAQWGEDYLWKKWQLEEDIAAIRQKDTHGEH